MKNKIDLELLEQQIETMQYHTPLFSVLKRALGKRGYWQNLPRGNPRKGYEMKLLSRDKLT